MKPLSMIYVGFALFLILCAVSTGVTSAHAATRSYGSYSNYWNNSSEGTVSTSTIERGTSRRGVSSAAQKAIDALDDDAVEDIPIPVLLGVSVSDLYPNFGDPRDGGARTHEGEDILATKDDYIVSPTDAVVTSMGTGSSSGNFVYTANPGNETFVYMHLDKFAEDLKAGSVLKKGDLIGYVGNTGNASGGVTHLHFEIRAGRTATDPFPRLTKEFTTSERIKYVTAALKNVDDEEEDAAMLVTNYRSIFISARAQGIDLPSSIEDELEKIGSTVVTSSTFYRDLTIGFRGTDVTALQEFLIGEDTGKSSDALADAGATGYFGAITQAALAEYQADQNIIPSVGYFGPITRAHLIQEL